MRVLLDQAAPVVGDVEGNVGQCIAGIAAARAAGARIVVAPELAISGYPPRDLLDSRAFRRRCRAAAERVAQATGDVIALYGTPWCDHPDGTGAIRNVAVVAHRGQVVATVAKRLLPTYDVFDERRHFTAGTTPGRVEVDGLTLGVTVCEDLWNLEGFNPDPRYDVDPFAELGLVDVMVNLSGSPFHAGKARERRELVRRRAAAAQAPLFYCNQVGGNDHLLFDGGSLAADAEGRIIATAPTFQAAHVLVDLGSASIQGTVAATPDFAEEVFGALVMGIRDYAARTGFRSAVLGLSGGIDSALVAVLAAAALGPDNVWSVGLPGPYSSPGSLTDARSLADALGTRFDVMPITAAWEQLRAALAPVVDPSGLTAENLQARVRGTLLMGLSNARGHLLLTTGNKSELACGYCTLYGDMNGALAVIGDVYKTDVYRICRWINRDREIIPEATLTKPPSAELAPGQKDQDSLPPYEVLDALLRRHIDEGADAEDLLASGFSPALVERIVPMVARAEYKRWQAPPVLRVSRRAFGYGRRRPLAAR